MSTNPLETRLIDALLDLAQSRSEGILRLERGKVKKQLVIVDGLVLFAESTENEEHLAWIAVKLGLFPRSKVKEITALMRAGNSAEEAVLALLESNAPALENAIREQAITIVASLMGWDQPIIHLYAIGQPLKRKVSLQMPIPDLLVRAARRAAADRTIAVHNLTEATLSPAAIHSGALLSLPLSQTEAYVNSLVQVPTPLSALLPLIPGNEVNPEELIRRLLALGLIQISRQSASPPGQGSTTSSVDTLAFKIEDLLNQYETASLYEILDTKPDAGEDEIKAAYHELAKLYHPDLFQSAEFSDKFRANADRLFTFITGAYTTLSERALRAGYDETRLQKESRVEATLKARAVNDTDDEKMAETLYNAGRISMSKGEFDTAVEQLKECVWLRPNVARYQHHLGAAQMNIPKLRKESEQHLLRALELDGTFMESRLSLGKLYLSVNLPRKAESQFLEVLKWDPSNTVARAGLEAVEKPRSNRPPERFKFPFGS